jgi:mRNA-degrading endonuclease toxin of MazEF toxin-antitoxin module
LPPPPIRQGTIVWAVVPTPQGVRKRRPLVIVTADDQIPLQPRLAAVAVSTTFPGPPPPDHVPLPWDPTGRAATRLRRRSAAVCSWVASLTPDQVESVEGNVPPAVLLEILKKLPLP